MTAFQRGALRALGIGELVARVEAAETAAATHAAENAALTQRLAALSAALPLQVAAAATGHANEVSVQVRSELSALGVSAATAPPQISAADADKILARGEFDKLSHAERNQFFRNGGKLTN